ncbi:hypothetical protein CHARACLAT_028939 [Characodon lateralis]|uniref:Uncharacterized protein n=1 Tax=Characodon lateralis TaxID=208331 RepID=A0ABU7F789_9TELE|nr:hypothetical protein [Characodon lateralis]
MCLGSDLIVEAEGSSEEPQSQFKLVSDRRQITRLEINLLPQPEAANIRARTLMARPGFITDFRTFTFSRNRFICSSGWSK